MKLLQVRIQSGTFLVRESESTYALTIRCGDDVNHYVIMNAGTVHVNLTVPPSCLCALENVLSIECVLVYFTLTRSFN